MNMYNHIKNVTITKDKFQVITTNNKLYCIDIDGEFDFTHTDKFEYYSNGLVLRLTRITQPQFEIDFEGNPPFDTPLVTVFAPRTFLRSMKTDIKNKGIFTLNHRKHLRELKGK
jgi:hypothetical protein